MSDAVTATEKFDSRRLRASNDGKSSTIEVLYDIRGTNNEVTAKTTAYSASPPTWNVTGVIMFRQAIELELVGEDLWVATVHYDTSFPEPLAAEDSFEFDTTGGTQHITQALATSAYPFDAPNLFGAIGVTDSGVEGVDVVVPNLTFAETHFFAELSPAAKSLFGDITACVNSAPFRGWAAGEVLFLGASSRKENNKTGTPWSVTYRFSVQRNRSNFQVGGITVTQKRGWDYLDVRYESVDDDDSQSLIKVPVAVYVHQVYGYANFGALGIGF